MSRLFYDFPVDAYVAFSLNSIENLNGMVGGVTVETNRILMILRRETLLR